MAEKKNNNFANICANPMYAQKSVNTHNALLITTLIIIKYAAKKGISSHHTTDLAGYGKSSSLLTMTIFQLPGTPITLPNPR